MFRVLILYSITVAKNVKRQEYFLPFLDVKKKRHTSMVENMMCALRYTLIPVELRKLQTLVLVQRPLDVPFTCEDEQIIALDILN